MPELRGTNEDYQLYRKMSGGCNIYKKVPFKDILFLSKRFCLLPNLLVARHIIVI
jgi:hypothetical protein